MNRCFTKQYRLAKPLDFRHVFNTKNRSADCNFLVFARENGLKHARLGLVVPAKKIKKAVSRNRLKRLIRESFQHHNTVLAGMDVVIIPQKQARLPSQHNLRSSLMSHWERIARCRTSYLKQ